MANFISASDKNFKSKTDIAIDMFTKMLRDIAMKDNVEIEIKCNKHLLEMNAKAYDVVVKDAIPKSLIVDNLFDFKRMKSIGEYAYRILRLRLVEEFEYIELLDKYEEKNEDKVDEHWEFIELCGI